MAIDLIGQAHRRGPRSPRPRAGGPATADGDAGRAWSVANATGGEICGACAPICWCHGGALFVLVPLEVGMAWSEVAAVSKVNRGHRAFWGAAPFSSGTDA